MCDSSDSMHQTYNANANPIQMIVNYDPEFRPKLKIRKGLTENGFEIQSLESQVCNLSVILILVGAGEPTLHFNLNVHCKCIQNNIDGLFCLIPFTFAIGQTTGRVHIPKLLEKMKKIFSTTLNNSPPSFQ